MKTRITDRVRAWLLRQGFRDELVINPGLIAYAPGHPVVVEARPPSVTVTEWSVPPSRGLIVQSNPGVKQ